MLNVRPKVGVDCDDVLYLCNGYACQLANETYQFEPPLSTDEITTWGKRGDRSDIIMQYYERPEFVASQPLIPGAKEFIRKLMKIADVYIITAVEPKIMSVRMQRILEDFPEIPKENIIMGYQKSLIHVDFLLDDSPFNIMKSSAKYPVIFRRPWNANLHDYLSVDNYEDFLILVNHIQNTRPPEKKKFIVLVGPSGSGKTEIMKHLGVPVVGSVTTRAPRAGDIGYTYLTKEEFEKQDLLECSTYAGHLYGTRRDDVNKHDGIVIKAMDIVGALHTRTRYEDCAIVFVKRPKEKIIRDVLLRDVSLDDKVNRIVTLEREFANEKFADFVLENDGDIKDVVKKLLDYIND